jgi:CRISPR-associated RAMP protein (TIGR02581 family)
MLVTESPRLLDTFLGRVRLEGELITRTGLHIGAGGSGDPLGTDAPVVRDAAGNPFVPGSSLKGVMRSAAEALLKGAAKESLQSCDHLTRGGACVEHETAAKIREEAPKPRAAVEEIWRRSCTICRLFGSQALAGRVRFPDLPLQADLPVLFELRNGVGIHRDKELAASGVLYDFEAVPPGTVFKLTVILDNPSDPEVGLLLYLFDELDSGHLGLGGKNSRGLGQVQVRWLRIVETSLQKGNPFAHLLSSRDLLTSTPENAGEPSETKSDDAKLPQTGDRGMWRELAEILTEMPAVDKSELGQRVSPKGWSKESLNTALGLGLEGKNVRKTWDEILKRFVESGFLVSKVGKLEIAGREAAPPAAAASDEPAREPGVQKVIDHYVGALVKLWEEAH